MGFVDNARTLPTSPTGQQQQKKRTNDVLQTADIFTRYGQRPARGRFSARSRDSGRGVEDPFSVTDPVARGALSGRNLGIRHFSRDFAPEPHRVLVALHGRKIEPFMRGDLINRDIAPARILDAKLEVGIGVGALLTERTMVAIANLETGHNGLPLSRPSMRGLSRPPAAYGNDGQKI